MASSFVLAGAQWSARWRCAWGLVRLVGNRLYCTFQEDAIECSTDFVFSMEMDVSLWSTLNGPLRKNRLKDIQPISFYYRITQRPSNRIPARSPCDCTKNGQCRAFILLYFLSSSFSRRFFKNFRGFSPFFSFQKNGQNIWFCFFWNSSFHSSMILSNILPVFMTTWKMRPSEIIIILLRCDRKERKKTFQTKANKRTEENWNRNRLNAIKKRHKLRFVHRFEIQCSKWMQTVCFFFVGQTIENGSRVPSVCPKSMSFGILRRSLWRRWAGTFSTFCRSFCCSAFRLRLRIPITRLASSNQLVSLSIQKPHTNVEIRKEFWTASTCRFHKLHSDMIYDGWISSFSTFLCLFASLVRFDARLRLRCVAMIWRWMEKKSITSRQPAELTKSEIHQWLSRLTMEMVWHGLVRGCRRSSRLERSRSNMWTADCWLAVE